MNPYYDKIARELNLAASQVSACADLLADGGTVPFIARYRKEATGSLDEVQVETVRDRLEALAELDQRRAAILKSLSERELLTEELQARIEAAETMVTLEDIYLPYRPKRRTRASEARARGLEPLALWLLEQTDGSPIEAAEAYVNEDLGLPGPEEALAGARDIVAEMVSEDQTARERLRALYQQEAQLTSRVTPGQEEAGAKFRDYFDWQEPLKDAPSHRILAMRRGESEGFLSLSLQIPEEKALAILEGLFVKNDRPAGLEIKAAVVDGYKRLLSLSLETEFRLWSKKRADLEAIKVFADNLNELLLAPPLGAQPVIAVDPGFRTGCKVAVLAADGSLVDHLTIFPHSSEKNRLEAAQALKALAAKHQPRAVAVGNGTAGRETAAFIKSLPGWPASLPVVLVNESGASIYSASETARREFPDLDLTVRGAISIGRRLQDPLAELVKIDPKSIGVGQYQHDVNQGELKKSLDDVVIRCVNRVGVEANTASEELLTYVSGLGPGLAKSFVTFRREQGGFKTRRDFLKVPRLGPKAFELCAGFLRVVDSAEPLDKSAVHPEAYPVVCKMAADLRLPVAEMMNRPELRSRIDLDRYITEKFGRPTLNDILAELEKPGRDPRSEFSPPSFAEGLNSLEDLRPGLRLNGVVTNVTAFGAFIDVGVHQDGLAHVSELSDRFVKSPSEVVKVGQKVTATVLEVDLPRRRLALSLKSGERSPSVPAEKTASGSGRRPPKAARSNQLSNNPFAALLSKKAGH